ncbi:MAG: hypothetical protein L0229_07845 [Blastocatellia bacterium]|nr:hypothetical protein [Blastocatellia bacterium]
MNERSSRRLAIEGVEEFWLRSQNDEPEPTAVYRPALLVECSINFRSLRAGLNHSEERNHTAWIPERDMAIDWDSPAATFGESISLTKQPASNAIYEQGNYLTTKSDLERYEAELIDKLARSERLRLFFNPVFGLFSVPQDALSDFLARVAERALARVEPELKRLRNRFELQFEQVREAHSTKDLSAGDLSERLISSNLHFFESENRLAAMFSTLAGTVFGAIEPRSRIEPYKADEVELRESLERIEQEASRALRALYDEYLLLANEYDAFEIGLQHDNINVVRSGLLWVPVSE